MAAVQKPLLYLPIAFFFITFNRCFKPVGPLAKGSIVVAYQVLARKWRPKQFQDVIGQAHITNSLQNAITRNRLGHAYIMTGTRGIGKTSVARIFAKALRCENRLPDGNPCLKCPSCLELDSGSSMNVIEIDGASNNSVDDVRDLINNVHYLPTTGKYKIYIIDEVHMLSTSAFNALLKTLEEPPEHAKFIMATTEPHKLLETVLSRCQRFDFRNATVNDLVKHVEAIAEDEGIKFQNKRMIRQICRQGKGSVRDTLSLLDQVLSFTENNEVTEEALVVSLGLTSTTALYDLTNGLIAGNVARVSTTYRSMLNENIPVKNIVTAFLDHLFEIVTHIDERDYLQSEMLVDPSQSDILSTAELLWIFETLGKESGWILDSIDPEKLLEILFHKLTLRRELLQNKTIKLSTETVQTPSPAVEPEKKTEELAPIFEEETSIDQAAPMEPPHEEETPATMTVDFSKAYEAIENGGPVEVEGEPVLFETEPDNPRIAPEGPSSWDGFCTYLAKENSATATYLDHGNVLGFALSDERLQIDYGFPEKYRVMYDHVQENREKILGYLESYFGVGKANIQFNVEMINQADGNTEFRSKVEIIEEAKQKEQDEKKNNIATNELIQTAESLFNTKVDKIILNND
ncbi:MAG: DNA polymerase III subunit gamma/tau [Deltaproteobacteria bacterium]|nr:MAG: DNA polymerase III subunit gamma/tau [Deltaproteobacteria bacterium]